jgi:hypothetical protein
MHRVTRQALRVQSWSIMCQRITAIGWPSDNEIDAEVSGPPRPSTDTYCALA